MLAEENIEEYVAVPGIAGGDEGEFLLTVKGDSMMNAGILEGDHVVVTRQDNAANGEIVVALVEDEATVKRFFKEDDHVRLQPENDALRADPRPRRRGARACGGCLQEGPMTPAVLDSPRRLASRERCAGDGGAASRWSSALVRRSPPPRPARRPTARCAEVHAAHRGCRRLRRLRIAAELTAPPRRNSARRPGRRCRTGLESFVPA